jgi:hypothetical protein
MLALLPDEHPLAFDRLSFEEQQWRGRVFLMIYMRTGGVAYSWATAMSKEPDHEATKALIMSTLDEDEIAFRVGEAAQRDYPHRKARVAPSPKSEIGTKSSSRRRLCLRHSRTTTRPWSRADESQGRQQGPAPQARAVLGWSGGLIVGALTARSSDSHLVSRVAMSLPVRQPRPIGRRLPGKHQGL